MTLPGFFLLAHLITGPSLFAGTPGPPLNRQVYLMGTVAQFQMYTPDSSRGEADLEALIRLLYKVESRLSTWRTDSTLSRLNQAPPFSRVLLDPLTCRLLPELRRWVEETGGTFDPAIGSLVRAWDLRGKGRIPTREDLEQALRRSGMHLLASDDQTCRLARTGEVLLDAGAFGKGAALDELLAYSKRLRVDPWRISLGGQVTVHGEYPGRGDWEVAIAAPQDRGTSRITLRVRSGSVAVSGNSERAKRVNGQPIGHVLDPRNGRPAHFRGSVAVWHEEALVADLLSTALFVMGPEKGLPWAEARELAAAFLHEEADGAVWVDTTSVFAEMQGVGSPPG